MPEIYNVQNLDEALKLAIEFKKTGKYRLFRGQARNWEVIPTIGRILDKNLKEVTQQLERLYMFFETTPHLNKYVSDIDWFFAVAQHYGIPTNYIDFTSNIDTAFFFATNSKSNKVGELCSIICLDEDDFIRFVEFTKIIYQNDKVVPPYIVKVDVNNLWRLQAQDGCFLFTPYANIEMYYNFDKIVFPFSHSYNKLYSTDIYPDRKSELEILLDHYFNSEQKIQGYKRLRKFSEEVKIPFTTFKSPDFNEVIKSKDIHKSWMSVSFNKWNYVINEKWLPNEQKHCIPFELQSKENYEAQTQTIVTCLKQYFKGNSINRMTPLEFEINVKPKISKKLSRKINRSCQRIWDGTRNLPFSDDEIFSIISKYVFLEIHKNKNKYTFPLNGEPIITLEMTNEYGSITRCYASPSKICSSFRNDLKEVLIDELTQIISSEILLHINITNIVFDFEKLLDLFKDEIIAYQILHNSEEENPVIFYTPTLVSILGYA
ncbi:MAG TPA: FRG domain-containing protein [Edaphocola sp.]|nr:FRG domain-containing protein [Edaphocola sp.]